ncbi:cytochrome c oxidase assembly protein [Methyloceanibacter marginalis]|uniref:cytochrome c oxidase assembly protein n=1 Tax=Methyloceanibacter marginalis TaxID=1774971 RepID=UPI00084BD7E8|nr:cytochrome c oxidase assembly protein [Methyloceanibacter marginalis]
MRVVSAAALAALVALFCDSAAAHFVEDPASHPVQWSFDAWVVASLATAILLYALGLYRLHTEVGPERVLDRSRVAAFAGGMIVLFIALCSPVDTIGGELFSMHMVQHLLLMLLAPPLLVWSRPNIAFVWAFSPDWRKRIGRFWTGAGLGRATQALMHPLVVFVLFSGSFAFWHLPGPYRAALHNDFIHALEHLSFFLTSLAFWTLVIEPSGRRRLSYGGGLVFVALTAVLCALPGALIVLAPRALYPDHAAGAAGWGLSLMQDQQLAGLLMWIPGGIVYLLACVWLFLCLMDDAEQKAVARHRSLVTMALLAIVVPPLLGGCDLAESTPKEATSATRRVAPS